MFILCSCSFNNCGFWPDCKTFLAYGMNFSYHLRLSLGISFAIRPYHLQLFLVDVYKLFDFYIIHINYIWQRVLRSWTPLFQGMKAATHWLWPVNPPLPPPQPTHSPGQWTCQGLGIDILTLIQRSPSIKSDVSEIHVTINLSPHGVSGSI